MISRMNREFLLRLLHNDFDIISNAHARALLIHIIDIDIDDVVFCLSCVIEIKSLHN